MLKFKISYGLQGNDNLSIKVVCIVTTIRIRISLLWQTVMEISQLLYIIKEIKISHGKLP